SRARPWPGIADAHLGLAQQPAVEAAARDSAARQAQSRAASRAALRGDPASGADAAIAEGRCRRAAHSDLYRRADRRGADPEHEPVPAARADPPAFHARARAARDQVSRAVPGRAVTLAQI